MTDHIQQTILGLPEYALTPAVQIDGSLRESADVAELTGLLPDLVATGRPPGLRVIVRRERIRTGKDTGYGRFPSRHFAINAA